MNGFHIHHRRRARVGSVITREFAEGALGQSDLIGREKLPFKDDLRPCGQRQARNRPIVNLDRATLDGASESIFRLALGQIFKARNEQGGILPIHHSDRTGLAAIPIFAGDHVAMPTRMIELDRDPPGTMDLNPIDGGVDPSRIGISHDDKASGPDIGTTVFLVPMGRGENGEVHIGAALTVLHI